MNHGHTCARSLPSSHGGSNQDSLLPLAHCILPGFVFVIWPPKKWISIAIILLAPLYILFSSTSCFASGGGTIIISPASGSVDLAANGDPAATRYARIPVTVTTDSPRSGRSVDVYACMDTGETAGMRYRNQEISLASLFIMNDQGFWQTMHLIPEVPGCRGVHIAIVRSATASFVLQLRMTIPNHQIAGTYQGLLTLVARER